MKVIVDVANTDGFVEELAEFGLRHEILAGRMVGDSPPPVVLIEGPREKVESWLAQNGYVDGCYRVEDDA